MTTTFISLYSNIFFLTLVVFLPAIQHTNFWQPNSLGEKERALIMSQ